MIRLHRNAQRAGGLPVDYKLTAAGALGFGKCCTHESSLLRRRRAVDENHARVRLAAACAQHMLCMMVTAAPLPTAPDEFVPEHLRERLRWTTEHDPMGHHARV